MDFACPPEAEAFRKTLRAWLAEDLEPRFRDLERPLAVGPERIALLREWNAKPAGYGMGLAAASQALLGGDAARHLEAVATQVPD